MFVGFLVFQALLLIAGICLASFGKELPPSAIQKLESMQQVFLTVCTLGMVLMIVFTRSRLHPDVVSTPQALLRETAISLGIGELVVLLALLSLARLHLTQFVLEAALVFVADFVLIRSAALKLLDLPAPKKTKTRGNKSNASFN